MSDVRRLPAPVPDWNPLFADDSLFNTLPCDVQAAVYETIAVMEARFRARMLTKPTFPASPRGNSGEDSRFVTMKELKVRTGLSLSHLYELARTGKLPVTPMGTGNVGKRPRGYRVWLPDFMA
jgi:predicted DNA-binding transcriptional regulator AlpA